MISATSFASQNILVFGLGGSGIKAAQSLVAGGANVTAWDDNETSVGNARDVGIRCENLREIDWAQIHALVLAPGVPLTHPEPHWSVKLAQAHNVEIIGDIEIFQRELDLRNSGAKFVAVTGTNGKSTTTALISHTLSHAGYNVQMGGNIGTAILDLEEICANSVYVVECSSYQIDLAPSLAPDIGILLNITPDHLDRHGSIENYAKIKSRLVLQAKMAAICVDDEHCKHIAAQRKSESHTRVFSNSSEVELGYFAKNGVIFSSDAGQIHPLANLQSAASLAGPHNAQNAAAAVAVACEFDLSEAQLQKGFDSFSGLSHRMEMVAQSGGVLFVNDSKATNAQAVAPAIASFEKIHWILGGVAKAEGIEPLLRQLDCVVQAYLIGEAAHDFSKILSSQNVPFIISRTIEQAVEDAHKNAQAGEVVLLSPACASFDQYRNFELRGDAFKAKVKDLLHS